MIMPSRKATEWFFQMLPVVRLTSLSTDTRIYSLMPDPAVVQENCTGVSGS
ncbi:Hypothetical protein PROPJV5_2021 [Propionibacterium ruminifibrarum]|uniref:Uncharacterized protein n=1 Tax=Propionibacterium ruminifibrarum TaxID=1962131 RepID=A0A375I4N4_9ACTN|nr:Hypothetical protein PROPJV5_2021 [Propionibacterium ruminifibrarum]